MSGGVVRPYQPSDFTAVCRIYADAKRVELKFERGVPNFTPLEKDDVILAAFMESDVVVYEGDDVVGFAASYAGQLRALFVHGAARGRGVGQALLNAVLADAESGVSLHVAKSNAGAIAFYAKNGFVIVDEAVRHYGGVEIAYAKMFRARGRAKAPDPGYTM